MFTEWLSDVDGSCICSACDGRALGDLQRLGTVQQDGALIEYQQQLWRTLAQVKNIEDRRSLLYVLERTTTGGRAVLYDMVEGGDSWPPLAPRDDPQRHSPRR